MCLCLCLCLCMCVYVCVCVQGRSQGGFPIAQKNPLRSKICLFVEAEISTMCAAKRFEVSKEIETSQRFRGPGECNGNESFHDKPYPSLGLRSPSDLGGFHI